MLFRTLNNSSARQDFFLSLAVANVMLLAEWSNFTYPRSGPLALAPHFLNGLLGLWLCLVAATIFFFLFLQMGRELAARFRSEAILAGAHVPLLLAFLAPLNFLRTSDNLALRFRPLAVSFWTSRLGTSGSAVLFLAFLGGAAFLFVRSHTRSVPRFRMARVPLLVFASVTLLQSIVAGAHSFAAGPARLPKDPRNFHRLIIHVFDEASEKYVAAESRGPFPLPALDRLRSEAFHATDATSPASMTGLSLPAYVTGAFPTSTPDTDIPTLAKPFFTQERSREVAAMPTLFADAKRMGLHTASVGYYIPSCRLYGANLDLCASFTIIDYDYSGSVFANAGRIVGRLGRLRRNDPRHQLNRIRQIAEAVSLDPDYQLIFIHWPIPHLPALYDPKKKVLTEGNDYSELGYRANLTLVDKIFGEMREQLERANLWNETAVIVTSDHGVHSYRCWKDAMKNWEDERVPFLVKLAGQNDAVRFTKRFNTLVLKELSHAILSGDIPDTAALARWLDNNGHRTERIDPVRVHCDGGQS